MYINVLMHQELYYLFTNAIDNHSHLYLNARHWFKTLDLQYVCLYL